MASSSRFSGNKISKSSNIILNILFSIYGLLCLVPILLLVIVSFSDSSSINKKGYSLFPSKWSTYAYEYLFRDISKIMNAYGVSITVTVFGTILSLLLVAMCAYPLSRRDLPGRSAFTFYLFFTMLFSGGLVPWYILITRYLYLKDTIFVLFIPCLVNPFNVFIMRTFFTHTIPDAVIESARIDGAGEFRTLFQIVLPISLPVFATLGLFIVIGFWNDYYMSMVFINKAKLYSLQFLMYKVLMNIQVLKSSVSAANPEKYALLNKLPEDAVRMAMVVVSIGPIILAFPFFQKYLVKGLTIGSVKG